MGLKDTIVEIRDYVIFGKIVWSCWWMPVAGAD